MGEGKNVKINLEGCCHGFYVFTFQGFDEYMNLVLDEAEEVHLKSKTRKPIGII